MSIQNFCYAGGGKKNCPGQFAPKSATKAYETIRKRNLHNHTIILTSTKNASLIITDFLAMVYKNEQPRTASLCRGWAMLENDLNLICR